MASENGQTISHRINVKRIHFTFNAQHTTTMTICTRTKLSTRSLFLYSTVYSVYCLQFYDRSSFLFSSFVPDFCFSKKHIQSAVLIFITRQKDQKSAICRCSHAMKIDLVRIPFSCICA